MAERRGQKRTYISISSSEDDDNQSESESESEEYDDDDEAEETSASISCSDDDDDDESGSEWSDDNGDESDDHEDDDSSDLHNNNDDDDESLCNGVICLLRERSDLQELNLKDCKAYLRQHGLRITGTKAECIQRIMEHWRIKNGNAAALYPRSSFSINCTGDVCKGDIVLFKQKVYKKFDKVTRTGNFLGMRTIAGRVVKESYGVAKQQHTFTIEVLWSKGAKKLLPLFPLLVKGRNLYKLKTFRQCWKNETERRKVLAEKHKRGAAARLVRAMKRTKAACSKNGGVNRQKHVHHAKPSPMGKKAELEKTKCGDRRGKVPVEHVKSNNHRQKAPPVGRAKLNRNSKAPKSSNKPQNRTHVNKNGDPKTKLYTCPPQNFHQSRMQFQHHPWNAPLPFPHYEAGSTSYAMRFPHFRPFVDSSIMPISQRQGLNHGYYPHHAHARPHQVFEPRNWNQCPELMNPYGLSRPFSLGTETYEQRRRGL